MKYTLIILALLLSACGDDEVQPPVAAPVQVQTDPQLQLLQQQQLLLQQQQQELRQLEAQVQAPIQQQQYQQPQQQYQQQAPVIVQQPQHSGLNDMLLGGLIGHAIAGGGNNQPSRQVTNVTRNYYQAPRPRSSSVYRRSSSYRH
jgi:hypothetical protein